jgi:hypothetical protein
MSFGEWLMGTSFFLFLVNLAGKYVSLSWAVHAGFEKFCIPMNDRWKKEFRNADAVFKGNGASVQPCRATQNAGCMMAIHANCTKSKIYTFCILLIYNEIL